MISLGFLVAIVATAVTANAPIRPADPRTPQSGRPLPPGHPHHPKSNTVIENRNVNIIVNVDPKDVANELYKLIQSRLDARPGRRTDDSRATKKELEKTVTPIVTPGRRSLRPTPFEVAYKLDHITRKALLGDRLATSTIDDEIVVREVVVGMLSKLRSVTEAESVRPQSSRRMQTPIGRNDYENEVKSDEDDDDDDDPFIDVTLKIRKSELLRRSGKSADS